MTNTPLLRTAGLSHNLRDWWRRMFGFEPDQAVHPQVVAFSRSGRLGMIPPGTTPAVRVKRVLLEACAAVRLAEYDRALELLATIEPVSKAPHAACYHNIIGVIHEAHREWRGARKSYGRALSADKAFAPAQQNLRRLYELWTFGRSHEGVLLGDEMADVWMAHLPEEQEVRSESCKT